MIKSRLYLVVVLLSTLSLFLGACGRVADDAPSLEDIRWILVSYGEKENLYTVLEGTEVAALFNSDDGIVRGSSGCNNYGGAYETNGNNLSVAEVEYTEMGCLEPEGIMEQEEQYLRILPNADSYEISDGRLRITADSQVLIFRMDGPAASEPGVSLEFSCDSFTESSHISLSYAPEIKVNDSLTITLCSNPTTGFRWSHSANISNQTVLKQVGHTYTPPEAENVVGGAGKETWTFQGFEKGMSSISLEYSRPWEGGEKSHWTFSITVFVN